MSIVPSLDRWPTIDVGVHDDDGDGVDRSGGGDKLSGDVTTLESYSFGDELLSFTSSNSVNGSASLESFKYFSNISMIKNMRWLSLAVYPSSSDSFVGGLEMLDEPLDLVYSANGRAVKVNKDKCQEANE